MSTMQLGMQWQWFAAAVTLNSLQLPDPVMLGHIRDTSWLQYIPQIFAGLMSD
jgi:hypothetical protein